MNCAYCDKKLTPWMYPLIAKETFCNPACMESFYLKQINSLSTSLKIYKAAWWQQRDIIGKHGIKIMRMEYPNYFEEGSNEKG
jgi:hypothetical protein